MGCPGPGTPPVAPDVLNAAEKPPMSPFHVKKSKGACLPPPIQIGIDYVHQSGKLGQVMPRVMEEAALSRIYLVGLSPQAVTLTLITRPSWMGWWLPCSSWAGCGTAAGEGGSLTQLSAAGLPLALEEFTRSSRSDLTLMGRRPSLR